MSYQKLTPAQRRERAQAAHQQLAAAVQSLQTADGWRAMIRARAWLRKYSLSNLLMITQQCPDATDVRPLREWNKLGRRVRKGERAIRIWAPTRRRNTDPAPTDHDDPDIGAPGHGQQPAQAVAGFVLVPVFDVSQTEGDPLPAATQPRPALLTGDAPAQLWEELAGQVRGNGYRVARGDCGGANGRTDFTARTVTVRSDVPAAQAIKTLAHELGHILLDHEHSHQGRDRMEVEAESVACSVTAAAGLSSLAYSVPYVASWAGEDTHAVKESAARVMAVADQILAGIPTPAPEHAATANAASAGSPAAGRILHEQPHNAAAGPPLGLTPPGTDQEFLTSCAELAAALHGLAGQLTGWVEALAGLGVPEQVTAPLRAGATALTVAAGHAEQAAAGFADHYDQARQMATHGLALIGDHPI